MSKQEIKLRGLFLILLFMVMRRGRETWRNDLEAWLMMAIEHFKLREERIQSWERWKTVVRRGEEMERERQKEEWI